MSGRLEQTTSSEPLPLVLLPGTLCDEALFAPVLAELAPARAVTVGDLGGAGSAHALARIALDGAPARFALAGFSLGGIVAIEMAARAPDRVAGLALIASTARPVPEGEQQQRRVRARGVTVAADHLADGWRSQVGARARHDLRLRDTLVAMADRGGTAALLSQTEVALTRPDNRPRLPLLAMPALVLAGLDDATNPPPVQEEAAALLPDAVLELVPGAGHFLPLEAPAATAAALRRWLVRVDWAELHAAATIPRPPSASLSHRSDQEML